MATLIRPSDVASPAIPASPARRIPVALIAGDGIGPEITAAVRRVLDAAGAAVDWHEVPAGTRVPGAGTAAACTREAFDVIERTGVVLKGPLAIPEGSGMRCPGTALRAHFETYANVRPARELPGVHAPFAGRGVNLVIVRDSAEDLSAGIEHMQTPTVAQALKLVSRAGCERVARLACELAEDDARRGVVCATRSDILGLTEGMMQRVFEEVAAEYPALATRHLLVDDLAHQLALRPERFDVIVTTGMHGDILGALAAAMVGGRILAPSANVGRDVAFFEAMHGTAPDLAGRDLANPTGLLLSAVMLLRHAGDLDAADRVEHALRATLRAGIHTADLGSGSGRVGTVQFADAVIERLSQAPAAHRAPRARAATLHAVPENPRDSASFRRERTVGVDIFLQSTWSPDQLGQALSGMTAGTPLRLCWISNGGRPVYPDAGRPRRLADQHHCRFVVEGHGQATDRDLLTLFHRITLAFCWMHVERLRDFDGARGFAVGSDQAEQREFGSVGHLLPTILDTRYGD